MPSDPPRAYRPEFLAALDLLARASELMAAEGHARPILVGGAVVEFDTRSLIVSGDFDLVCGEDEALARALLAVGFQREERPGHRRGGFYHPEIPIAVDVVSGRYYEGRAERARLRLVGMPSGDVAMAPIEEIIVDRIGQWEASDWKDRDLEAQIRALLLLAVDPDEAYVERRLQEESGLRLDLPALRRRLAEGRA